MCSAELAPARVERVRRTPLHNASRECQAQLQGRRGLRRCFFKMGLHQRPGVCRTALQQCAAAPIGRGPCCNAYLCESVGCCMLYSSSSSYKQPKSDKLAKTAPEKAIFSSSGDLRRGMV